MGFRLLKAGFMTTIQDLGRAGYERFGVPPSGAMDWFSMHAANRLVGNHPEQAGLEFCLLGPTLQSDSDCLVSLCGGGFSLWVGGWLAPAWTAVWVRAGEVIELRAGVEGFWGYLGVSGGVAVDPVLGSRSTALKSRFGGVEGRSLREGDWLACGAGGTRRFELAGSRMAFSPPDYSGTVDAGVLPGPQEDWFGLEGLGVFFGEEFIISEISDRMAYRLQGAVIPRRGGEILSEGMVNGSVQVPPDGQPIVMMSERPTTGGYPKIGAVIRADLPRVAQLPPGSGRVRFHPVTLAEAQAKFRERLSCLAVERDDPSLWMAG